MNKKKGMFFVVFFLINLNLYGSTETPLKEFLNRYVRAPLSAFAEQDLAKRPDASSLNHKAAIVTLYFLATWTSILIDRFCSTIPEDEFVLNFTVQTLGWWIALGENFSHDRYRNFYMNTLNKIFAIAIICATSNPSIFSNFIKTVRLNGFLIALKGLAPANDIGLSVLRIMPQCVYILALPTHP